MTRAEEHKSDNTTHDIHCSVLELNTNFKPRVKTWHSISGWTNIDNKLYLHLPLLPSYIYTYYIADFDIPSCSSYMKMILWSYTCTRRVANFVIKGKLPRESYYGIEFAVQLIANGVLLKWNDLMFLFNWAEQIYYETKLEINVVERLPGISHLFLLIRERRVDGWLGLMSTLQKWLER